MVPVVPIRVTAGWQKKIVGGEGGVNGCRALPAHTAVVQLHCVYQVTIVCKRPCCRQLSISWRELAVPASNSTAKHRHILRQTPAET